MRLQDSLSLLSAVVALGVTAQEAPKTGAQGDALAVKNNPQAVVYVAELPAQAFTKAAFPNGGNVKGCIKAMANPNGQGVMFKVHFENLPKEEGGPFTYHLHDAPVPESGNCTATLAHLDPFIRGEDPVCDNTHPERCQVGDMSGKHGKVTSNPFDQTYSDDYAATLPGIGAFFGNRSFVLHYPNKTRITCANFKKVTEMALPSFNDTGCGAGSAMPTASGGGHGHTLHPASPTSTLVTVSGAAAVSSALVPVALLATIMMFML